MSATRKISHIDSSVIFREDTDYSKQMQFELINISVSTTRTVTFPDADILLMGPNTTNTLTNKSLVDTTSYFVNNGDNTKKLQFDLSGLSTSTTRTVTIPNANTTLVGTDVSQILTNKTLTTNSTYFQDNADNTKKIQWDLTGLTTATTRTIIIPDANTTMVGTGTTQTLTNKSINADNNTITNIANASIKASANIDATKIADGSVSSTQFQYLSGASSNIQTQINNHASSTTTHGVSGTIVGTSDTQTLTNKTFTDSTTLFQNVTDNTKKFKWDLSAITTGTTRTFTMPDVNTTIVGTNVSQTLTNKTIDADSNTITNIDNNEIKASAGIDATKIANGTVTNTHYQYLSGATSNIQTQISNHTGNTSNPHSVTKSQVGLSNVENTKVNLNSTSNPSTTDDTNSGYSVGSVWANVSTDKAYMCLDATASGAVWKEITYISSGVGQPQISYNSSSSESSTTSTSWTQKVRLTFTANAADYLIQWYAEVKSSSVLADAKFQIQEDDTTTHGYAEWDRTGWFPVSGFVKTTLTATSHNFDIDYATSNSSKSISIRNARISAMELS